MGTRPEEGWGQEEWADDDKIRTIAGQQYEPWKSWDQCSGPWKFPNGLMQFLKDAGFKSPTPIQAHVWPVLLDGRDVIGVAKTGSGKTLAFLLPGYIKVKRAEMTNEGPKLDCAHNNGPAMMVVAPTRELCQQIFEESERFGQPAQIRTACVYGGAGRQPQQRSLWSGPHCVVATPGRLKDFLEDRSIFLSQTFYVILDEADRMLDMGFAPAIKELEGYLPQARQVGLFTATWPREIQDIGARFTKSPTHIQVGTSDACTSNADIRQHIHVVRSENDKMAFLENKVFPRLQNTNGSALIFLKTKRGAAQLYSTLSRAGAPIVCLHGDMEQRERDHSLWAFKQGKAKVLVATDVAQRGLDIKNVEMVVNYDPPQNMEDYVHRIGRTGRAGNKGDAFTFLYENETGMANNIMKVMRKTKQEIPDELKTIASGGYNQASDRGGWGGARNQNGGGYKQQNLSGEWGGKYAGGGY